VDDLAPSFGLASPRIVIHSEVPFAMLVHGPERPHTIALAPFCAQLDTPQLKAILAHEIAHCNRPHRFVIRINDCLLWLALPAAVVAFTELALPFATQLIGTTLGHFAAIPLAIWCSIVIQDTLDFASKYMSRNHELATDLRAILATGDPEGFLGALETTWLSMSDQSKTAYETERSSHPSFARRTNTIKEVCGIEAQIARHP
jgi:Zn-dependent protease with chaperone function